jgi:hypothetical protein
VLEQLHPQVLERALANPVDEVGLRVRRDPVHDRARHERQHDQVERAQVLRLDRRVDRAAREVRRR